MRLVASATFAVALLWIATGRAVVGASPDDLIAYVRITSDTTTGIAIASRGSTVDRLVTDGTHVDSWPSWSPDGTQLAFERRLDDGTSAIFVLDLATGDTRQLLGGAGRPEWSPAGDEIAYLEIDAAGATGRLGIVDVAGNGALQSGGAVFGMGWSGDGSVLAGATARGYFIHADAGNTEVQMPGAIAVTAVALSPDATRLAVATVPKGLALVSLSMIELRTGFTTPIEIGHVADRPLQSLAWSPDGTQIAFDGRLGNKGGLWVAPSDGSAEPTTPLLADDIAVWVRNWSPDGASLVYEGTGVDAAGEPILAKRVVSFIDINGANLVVLVGGFDPAVAPAGTVDPGPPQPSCVPRAGFETVVPAGAQPLEPGAFAIEVGSLPYRAVVDSEDIRERVFVTAAGPRRLQMIDGRPSPPRLVGTSADGIEVGQAPMALALEPRRGWIVVGDWVDCQIRVITGRATEPSTIQAFDPGGRPDALAAHPSDGRLFVGMPGRIAVFTQEANGFEFERDLLVDPSLLTPDYMLVDAERNLLYVSDSGGISHVDTALGRLLVVDLATTPGIVVGSVPLSVPQGIAQDPERGTLFVCENAADRIATVTVDASGAPSIVAQTPVTSTIRNNPDDINPSEAVYLPRRGLLAVAFYGSPAGVLGSRPTAQLQTFAVGADGSLTPARQIEGTAHVTGVTLDALSGRVYGVERDDSRLVSIQLEDPSPPDVGVSLPGPFDLKITPIAVVATASLTAFVMLVVGLPSRLFNSTLSANLTSARRLLGFARLRRPRGRFRRPVLIGAYGLRRLGRTLVGAILYLALAVLIYSLREPVGEGNRLLAGVVTLAIIVVTTAVAGIVGAAYVRRRYHAGSRFRIAFWTGVVALICVVIGRLAGAHPGYIYGIIGVSTFTVTLSVLDRGQIAQRTAVALLAVGLIAWFARIPFQTTAVHPETITLGLNMLLAGVFIASVEALVFGLIPLRFLPGENLARWSVVRWLVLWAIGLALFAYVILLPPSDYIPNTEAVGFWTVAITVAVYGLVALAFWAYFAVWRPRQLKRNELAVVEGEPEQPAQPEELA
jgi:Tol biopolymer transport system component